MLRAISALRALRVPIALLAAPLGAGRSATIAQAQRQADGAVPHAHVVRVIAHDFAFEMPDTIPAGLITFRLRNAGMQPHHLMFYRIEPGKSLRDVLDALTTGGAHPSWMHAAGGPNAILGGDEAVGTLLLAPGTYVAFCEIPAPDQVLHFAKGMMKTVTVTPTSARPAPLPRADLTVTLRDYGFVFSHPPTRGHHRIAVTNRGTQPHELILSKLAPGKTNADFVRWIETQDGLPPVQPYGGTTDLPPGGTIVIDVDLQPGTYSVLCRVRDAKDGQPHDRHGMASEFIVR